MQTLNNLTLISGGNASTLPLTLGEQSITYFDRPIIGYTQTLVTWKLTHYECDPIDIPNPSFEYACYTAVYQITGIYG